MSASSSRAVSISTGTGVLGLDPPAHLQPVEAGQHHVQDDEVRARGGVPLDRTRAVVRLLDGEPLGPQPVGDGVVDDALVLDDQHAPRTHVASVGAGRCRAGAQPGEGFVEMTRPGPSPLVTNATPEGHFDGVWDQTPSPAGRAPRISRGREALRASP